MFSSLLLADIFVLFFDFVVLALIGVGLIFLADYLKRRRDDEFLGALNEIINGKNSYKNDTGKKSDE